MARFSRIAACGQISTYNKPDAEVNLNNFFQVVSQRIHIRGFIGKFRSCFRLTLAYSSRIM